MGPGGKYQDFHCVDFGMDCWNPHVFNSMQITAENLPAHQVFSSIHESDEIHGLLVEK